MHARRCAIGRERQPARAGREEDEVGQHRLAALREHFERRGVEQQPDAHLAADDAKRGGVAHREVTVEGRPSRAGPIEHELLHPAAFVIWSVR